MSQSQDIGFDLVVTREFLFLCDHGYQIANVSPKEVVFESDKYRLKIYVDIMEEALYVAFGPINPTPGRGDQSTGAVALVAVFDPSAWEDYPQTQLNELETREKTEIVARAWAEFIRTRADLQQLNSPGLLVVSRRVV